MWPGPMGTVMGKGGDMVRNTELVSFEAVNGSIQVDDLEALEQVTWGECPQRSCDQSQTMVMQCAFPAGSKSAITPWGYASPTDLSFPSFSKALAVFSDSNILLSKHVGYTQFFLEMKLLCQMVLPHHDPARIIGSIKD